MEWKEGEDAAKLGFKGTYAKTVALKTKLIMIFHHTTVKQLHKL